MSLLTVSLHVVRIARHDDGLPRYRRVLQCRTLTGKHDDDEALELPSYIMVRDYDVVPAADPRIAYTLHIVQAARANPWPLAGPERARQIKGPGKHAAEPTGRAVVYDAVRVVAVSMPARTACTLGLLAGLLPPALRTPFGK